MKLSVPFVQLPLLFDAAALADEINALGEAPWMPHPQGFAGNSMLPLIALDGDPAKESFAGPMQATPLLQRCPYLRQVLASLGVTIGRTRLMRLSGHAEVKRHADQGYYWADRVRIHIPIVTQPTVRFDCGDSHVNMAAGECWIFDTWRQHRVLNDAVEARIHLVADSVGGERFWAMAAAGRDHQGRAFSGAWQPQRVLPAAGSEPELIIERFNVPVVMTTWELNARITGLINDAIAHPALPQIRHAAALLCRNWQALWAAHGELESGWSAYRQTLEPFMRLVNQAGKTMVLQNELSFASAMHTLVGKVAVQPVVKSDAEPPLQKPSAATAASNTRTAPAAVTDPLFDRPLFIVSSPRSGSSLLFETLAKAPHLFTIGGESHAVIEGIPALSPRSNGLGSNQLGVEQATASITAELRQRFYSKLVDRDGHAAGDGRVRMLEKTPKNALRIAFFNCVFPQAQFIYLYRDPREVMGSMIDAWQSGRFRTYPELPGWQGLPWSMLLTPGWQSLVGAPIAEVVAQQWETTTRLMLDVLEQLPANRVAIARYDALIANPQREIEHLCAVLDIEWDSALEGALPIARHTVSNPAPDKWRRHATLIEPQLARLQPTLQRAERFAARNQ